MLANVQRRLKRSPDDQAAEVERVRALTLQRLAGVAGPDRTPTTVASDPTDGPGASDPPDPTDPPSAAPAAGGPEADEAIDVTESVDQAPAAKVRQPLVFRIAGIDEPPAPAPPDPELEATPLVMFLGGPGSTWPADPESAIAGDPTDAVDAGSEAEASGAEQPSADAPAQLAEPAAQPEPPAPDPSPSVTTPPVATVVAQAYCPYCATLLAPPPASDRPCTECKQLIVVRHIDDRTVWLMEAALPVFEAERRRIADEERWTAQRAYWLDLAVAAGAPKARVAKAAEEAPTEARVGAARSLYLAAVDRSFEGAAKDDRWADAARLRFDEALVLFDFAGAPIPEIRGGDDA